MALSKIELEGINALGERYIRMEMKYTNMAIKANLLSGSINEIKGIAERALAALEKTWIRSRKIEAMMHHIINECDKYLNWYE